MELLIRFTLKILKRTGFKMEIKFRKLIPNLLHCNRCKLIFYSLLLILFILYWFSLPNKLFNDPCSTVIYASNNELLGAMIAEDGQWRFPEDEKIPDKFIKCICQFEDRHFYMHPGFNPVSLFRALSVNIKRGRIVQGGSTITMQTIRLSRKNKNRTIYEKVVEIILASRAEIRYSKNEILSLFASHAPFGSNVVGIDAASWRYFGRNPGQLSWAETATLAVLPNAPSLIFPGKNHEVLLAKRNHLLEKLYVSGIIDKNTFILSELEPLPSKPFPLPQLAPHLLTRIYNSSERNKQVKTTIDVNLQLKLNEIIEKHVQKLKFNGIYNAAALLADIETGNILAYVGNAPKVNNEDHQNDVDIIAAPRSTGSILKPILYAALLDAGEMLPYTLVPDIPVMMSGYSPKNYNKTYDGAVHAHMALSRSLNIPAVFMLKEYGIDRFYDLLKKLGMTTLDFPADRYGLSLILGGAEGSLWDITGIYAGFARTLNHFSQNSGLYDLNDMRPLNYLSPLNPRQLAGNLGEKYNSVKHLNERKRNMLKKGIINSASIWLTFRALLEVNRPEEEAGWEWFLSSKKVAWKTGTSFGFRDGWAIGTTSRFIVAVWTGNADGEGRPGLTGIDCAAPVMFDIFEQLPNTPWFAQPFDEMQRIPVCSMSGFRAGSLCSKVDTIWVQETGLKTGPCPYHKLVHLDKTGKFRVTSECESISQMQHTSWFILPPVQEWYYKTKNSFYKPLPPYKSGCLSQQETKQMDFIYPKDDAKVFVPIDIDNQKSRVVFEVAHRKPETTIYWHLDGVYIGCTRDIHQMGLDPPKGKHILDLVDENGNVISRKFEVK